MKKDAFYRELELAPDLIEQTRRERERMDRKQKDKPAGKRKSAFARWVPAGVAVAALFMAVVLVLPYLRSALPESPFGDTDTGTGGSGRPVYPVSRPSVATPIEITPQWLTEEGLTVFSAVYQEQTASAFAENERFRTLSTLTGQRAVSRAVSVSCVSEVKLSRCLTGRYADLSGKAAGEHAECSGVYYEISTGETVCLVHAIVQALEEQGETAEAREIEVVEFGKNERYCLFLRKYTVWNSDSGRWVENSRSLNRFDREAGECVVFYADLENNVCSEFLPTLDYSRVLYVISSDIGGQVFVNETGSRRVPVESVACVPPLSPPSDGCIRLSPQENFGYYRMVWVDALFGIDIVFDDAEKWVFFDVQTCSNIILEGRFVRFARGESFVVMQQEGAYRVYETKTGIEYTDYTLQWNEQNVLVTEPEQKTETSASKHTAYLSRENAGTDPHVFTERNPDYSEPPETERPAPAQTEVPVDLQPWECIPFASHEYYTVEVGVGGLWRVDMRDGSRLLLTARYDAYVCDSSQFCVYALDMEQGRVQAYLLGTGSAEFSIALEPDFLSEAGKNSIYSLLLDSAEATLVVSYYNPAEIELDLNALLARLEVSEPTPYGKINNFDYRTLSLDILPSIRYGEKYLSFPDADTNSGMKTAIGKFGLKLLLPDIMKALSDDGLISKAEYLHLAELFAERIVEYLDIDTNGTVRIADGAVQELFGSELYFDWMFWKFEYFPAIQPYYQQNEIVTDFGVTTEANKEERDTCPELCHFPLCVAPEAVTPFQIPSRI